MTLSFDKEEFEAYKQELKEFGFIINDIDDDILMPDGLSGCSMDTLLANILGFEGTNNFNDEDVYNVLLTLSKIDHLPYSFSLSDTRERSITKTLDLPENYVNLILCVLSDKECFYENVNKWGKIIEYGTSLQNCWIGEVGKMILSTREFDLIRAQYNLAKEEANDS